MDIQIKRAIAAMAVMAIVLMVLLLPLSSLDPPMQRTALLVGIIVCVPLLWMIVHRRKGQRTAGNHLDPVALRKAQVTGFVVAMVGSMVCDWLSRIGVQYLAVGVLCIAFVTLTTAFIVYNMSKGKPE